MPSIADIDAQIAKLQEQRRTVAARDRERERKRDARRKIILGGALLAAVGRGDPDARALYARLRRALPERDAKVFEGWAPPESEPAPDASQPGPGGPGPGAVA